MKNLLLILSILSLLVGCLKKTTPEPNKGSLALEVYKQGKLASGIVVANKTKALVRIWNSEGKDFEFKSYNDVTENEAFDKISQTFNNDYIHAANIIDGTFGYDLPPGKYFIVVRLDPSGGSAYSYTTFTLAADQSLEMKKTFSFDVAGYQFEEWDKNK